jgi:hypothetical protein
VIDVLRNFSARTFLLNSETFTYINLFKLPASVVQQLQFFLKDRQLAEKEFLSLLDERLPNLGPQQRSHVLDAAAVAVYHAQMEFPVIHLLICDDAPQFKLVTQDLALCWIHDGRLYKKLGINFYSYIYDRISDAHKIPNLADIIAQRAKELDLAASWDTSP